MVGAGSVGRRGRLGRGRRPRPLHLSLLQNKVDISDWASVQTLFDKLHKDSDKAAKAASLTPGALPRAYTRALAGLEDALAAALAARDAGKKLSASNAKALNAVRQRVRKHNAQPRVAAALVAWRADPAPTPEAASDVEGPDGADDDAGSGGERSAAAAAAAAGDDDGFQKVGPRGGAPKKDKLLTMNPAEITYEMVARKLRDLTQARGRKGVDRQEQLDMLKHLATVAKGPTQRAQALLQTVSALFDVNPSMSTHMASPLWRRCVAVLFDVLDLLAANPQITLDEHADPDAEPLTEEPAPGSGGARVWGALASFVERLDDELFKGLQALDAHSAAYVTRLRDEPPLLALAAAAQAHLVAAGDPAGAARVASRAVERLYYRTPAAWASLRSLVAQAIEEGAAAPAEGAATGRPRSAAPPAPTADDGGDLGAEDEDGDDGGVDAGVVAIRIPAHYDVGPTALDAIRPLVAAVHAAGDDRARARSALCTVYARAAARDFHGARDGILAAHLQDSVSAMDVSTQVLYNRTLAQLGLAAFRGGLFADAHTALGDLCGSGRVKELLAQGMALSRYHQDRTPEQEKLERRRQVGGGGGGGSGGGTRRPPLATADRPPPPPRPDAVPHAHQPGAAGIRAPRVRHAPGGARARRARRRRRAPPPRVQAVSPPARKLRARHVHRPARVGA